MTNPIEELAALDIDALWQRVFSQQPPPAAEFNTLVARLRQQYDAMQSAEDARLAAGKKRRRGTSKQPKPEVKK